MVQNRLFVFGQTYIVALLSVVFHFYFDHHLRSTSIYESITMLETVALIGDRSDHFSFLYWTHLFLLCSRFNVWLTDILSYHIVSNVRYFLSLSLVAIILTCLTLHFTIQLIAFYIITWITGILFNSQPLSLIQPLISFILNWIEVFNSAFAVNFRWSFCSHFVL